MGLRIAFILSFFIVTNSMAQVPNSWVKKSDFTGLKRERAVAFTANGKGYVGTGVDTAETVRKDFWSYDDVLDTWTQVADLPGSERRDAVGFSINNIGYVATGINTVNSTDIGSMKLGDMWRYDPVLNAWTQVSSFPGNGGQGVYFSAAFVVEGFGYVVGGKHGPNNYTSFMFRYDPTIDQWTQMSSFPGGLRYQLSALSIEDKGYVGLGTDQDLYRNDWWEYKPDTDTWEARADLPASARSNATTFTIGSRGFVCMGNNGGVLDDLWEYNPFSNTWSVRAPYGGSPRKSAVAFVLNGSAYVGTGKGISGKKQSMHQYHPMSSLGLDKNSIEVNVYPNPTSSVINIKTNTPFEAIILSDLSGRKIRSISNESSMNVADLSSGNYRLSVVQNGVPISNQSITIR